MFRIPDYVADTRLDGAQPPAVRSAPSIGRSVTRLGAAFGSAGDRLARQEQATRQAEAAHRTQRPPSAEERRLRDHIGRRLMQAGTFAAERHYLAKQAEADEAEAKARAAAGPSGAGFTTIYQRALGLIGREARAAMPADLADDHRAAIAARLDADHERRLARAAVEEVQSGRAQTRAELAGMQAALLAQLAREPELYEEIVAQGAAFTAGNILPDEETAARVADWYEQAEKALAAADGGG